jgi:hypothetical protein
MLWKRPGYDEAFEDLKLLVFKNNKWKVIYTYRMNVGWILDNNNNTFYNSLTNIFKLLRQPCHHSI